MDQKAENLVNQLLGEAPLDDKGPFGREGMFGARPRPKNAWVRFSSKSMGLGDFIKTYGDAEIVRVLNDQGEEDVSPNEVTHGDVVEVPDPATGQYRRYVINQDPDYHDTRRDKTKLSDFSKMVQQVNAAAGRLTCDCESCALHKAQAVDALEKVMSHINAPSMRIGPVP